MKIEIVVPVWGIWLNFWIEHCLPTLRLEAVDVDATIVAYTTEAGRLLLGDLVDEVRPLAPSPVGWDDQADLAHRDAVGRALAGGYAIAPLAAAHLPGRGTLWAAAEQLEDGRRAALALDLPCGGSPQQYVSAHALALWLARSAGILFWENRRTCGHPGHYAWKAQNDDAVLVRPIYITPALLRPTKPFAFGRAASDHFLVEGSLDDLEQVAFLQPADGCVAGIAPPVPPSPAGGAPLPAPHMEATEGIAARLKYIGPYGPTTMTWNLCYMLRRFWLGDPGEHRAAVEKESDLIVAEIAAAAATRKWEK